MADMAKRFTIVDVVEIIWSQGLFAENLTRLYGQALPSGSEKEQHCGTGPFLLALVEDTCPRYARRRLGSGRAVVNTATLDAKQRYRSWTGGGHRVHATLSPHETERDLFLLLGERPERFLGAPSWDGTTRTLRLDLTGARGWSTAAELLTALDVTLRYVVLQAADERQLLQLLVDDLWWARAIAKADRLAGSLHTVEIAGNLVEIDLRETGDGSLMLAWQSAILRERVRGADGTALPTPEHQLQLAIAHLGTAAADTNSALIPELARRAGAAAADYADPAAARRAHAAFLADLERDERAHGERSSTRFARLLRSARRTQSPTRDLN